MGVEAQNWALQQKVGGGSTKLVLLLLSDRADEWGKCWPGVGWIADKAEVDEKTVRRHINKIESQGLLTRIRKRRSDGTLGGYTYYLHLKDEPHPDLRTTSPNAPAGRLSGGDPESGESTDSTPQTPHETGPSESTSMSPNAPPGNLSAGQEGENGPPEANHRTMRPRPPDNEAQTTGQGARTEPSLEPSVGPPSSSSSARDENSLEEFLGDEHRSALDALRGLKGWGPRVEEEFVQRFVTGPMGELYLKGVPDEYQAAVVAECIWQFLEPLKDGTPIIWSGARFGGWLQTGGRKARRSVALAEAAETEGSPDGDGVTRLKGGGVLLPDGRRLTATQAAALERSQRKLAGRVGGGR